jgi:hypothetical protein
MDLSQFVTRRTNSRIRGFHVYCDESNTDRRKPHPVFGGILVAVNNLDTVQGEIAKWRSKEQMSGELAWTKVGGFYRQYRSLIDLFFVLSSKQRGLIHFKAFVLDIRTPEYRVYSKGNKDIGFYKDYYHFLLFHFAKFPYQHNCQMEVFIDERTVNVDPYVPLKIILNSGIRKHFKVSEDLVSRVEPIASEKSDLLQLADVLMGAVGFHNMDYHLREKAKPDKVNLARYIAGRLHLYDLKQETPKYQEYFKLERWYWGPRPPRKRRPADRRPRVGK